MFWRKLYLWGVGGPGFLARLLIFTEHRPVTDEQKKKKYIYISNRNKIRQLVQGLPRRMYGHTRGIPKITSRILPGSKHSNLSKISTSSPLTITLFRRHATVFLGPLFDNNIQFCKIKNNYCHLLSDWLVIGFIGLLKLVTASKCKAVANSHSYNSVRHALSVVSRLCLYQLLTGNGSQQCRFRNFRVRSLLFSLAWRLSHLTLHGHCLPPNRICPLLASIDSVHTHLQSRLLRAWVRVTVRLTVYRQSVHLEAKLLEAYDHRFFLQLNICSFSRYVTSSLTRSWVCLWWMGFAFVECTYHTYSIGLYGYGECLFSPGNGQSDKNGNLE
jgi:hypothetical protein